MNLSIAIALIGAAWASASIAADADSPSRDKIRNTRDYSDIRKMVESLRGKKFTNDVPVYQISDTELRAIADRELDKDYPGPKLKSYAELLAWLDMVPRGTDLKAVYGDFLVGQVAGLYDSDTKEMCIPKSPAPTNSPDKRGAGKKLSEISTDTDDIVLAHEFTHALEDQFWPLDVPEDHDSSMSTDQGTAHNFINEGSATRLMIEAIPAQFGDGSPVLYFDLWNLLHSDFGEWVLHEALSGAWKSPDVLVEDVPDALARTEAMPYSYGYTFCAKAMREWGLDGLDYIYDHPPVSSEQVMHPEKYWIWRDLPVQINLPETLPDGWKQTSLECIGEAGIAVLLGCQFDNLNRGLEIARGWDSDHAALYENGEHRVLLWASSWDSTNSAGRFVSFWLKERQLIHQASITSVSRSGNRIEWQSPDGRAGLIHRDRRRVILMEADDPQSLAKAQDGLREITFAAPPEDALRAATNSLLRRFNPVWSSQRDGDITLSKSFCGLLSRHDRNAVGAADSYVLGVMGESRRTASFRKWQVGAGLVAKHESEARRGMTRTTLLPWGVLASYGATRLPQSPDKTIMHETVVWGLAGSASLAESGRRDITVLPFGLLYHRSTGGGVSSMHILGTGVSHKQNANHKTTRTQVRILGIPVLTKINPTTNEHG
jgi:hypothetical protein